MFTNRRRIIIGVSLLLTFLLGILVGMRINPNSLQAENSGTQHARKTLRVTIGKNQWNELFEQFRSFADKWRYAIRIAPLDPNSNSFNVELWRSDMRLTAFMDTGFDNGNVQIHFYDTDRTRPVPEQYYDEEVNDLISFISKIPNVSVTQEK